MPLHHPSPLVAVNQQASLALHPFPLSLFAPLHSSSSKQAVHPQPPHKARLPSALARVQPSKQPQQPLQQPQTLLLVHRKPALPLHQPLPSTLGARLHLHLDRRRLQLHRLVSPELLLLCHLLVSQGQHLHRPLGNQQLQLHHPLDNQLQHLHHPLGSQQQQLHQHLVSQYPRLHRLLGNQHPHHLLGSRQQRHQHQHLGRQDHQLSPAPLVSQGRQPHPAPLVPLPPQRLLLVGSPLLGLLLGNLALQVTHLRSLPFTCCCSTSLIMALGWGRERGGRLLLSRTLLPAKNRFWVLCHVRLILQPLLSVKHRVRRDYISFASTAYALALTTDAVGCLFCRQQQQQQLFLWWCVCCGKHSAFFWSCQW